MLPRPTSDKFPEALKRAREAKQLNFTQLAKLCDISAVMPSRYEDRKHSHFGPPSEKTWKKLNQALFGIDSQSAAGSDDRKLLLDASTDELIQALKDRGASSVSLTF